MKKAEATLELITPERAKKMLIACPWEGCTNHFHMGQHPDGWLSLMAFPSVGKIGQRGKTVEVLLSKLVIDAALCPLHVRELKRLLGMAGWDALMREAEGTA